MPDKKLAVTVTTLALHSNVESPASATSSSAASDHVARC